MFFQTKSDAEKQVTKLRSEISSLEKNQSDLEQKRAHVGQRISELEARRHPLLTRIATGDEDARVDLRRVDDDRRIATEDAESYTVALSNVGATLDTVRNSLARAERESAIDALTRRIETLISGDAELESALAHVAKASASLFTETTDVAVELRRLDPRFDTGFERQLTSSIKTAIFEAVGEWNRVSHVERRKSFFDRVKVPLGAALAQLRYANLGGNVQPASGEKLYRLVSRITGLRQLDLRPGDRIALRAEEASDFLANGSLVMEQENVAA